MKRPTCLKIVGTLALTALVLGSVILLTTNDSSSSPLHRFLQSGQDQEIEREFNKFTSRYHKSYLTKAEYTARLQAFKANYETVRSHNSVKQPYQLGLNQFSDWTMEEYREMLNNMSVSE